VKLAPVEAEHYSFLYRLLTNTEFGWRYRFRGMTPPPDVLISRLWEGVLAQYLVVGVQSNEIHGITQLYDFNPRGQHCYAACIATPRAQGTGLVIEGFAALLAHGFRNFSLEKVYFEALDFNLGPFRSMIDFCAEEGRFVRHERQDGVWHDLVIYALTREAWESHIAPKAASLLVEDRAATV